MTHAARPALVRADLALLVLLPVALHWLHWTGLLSENPAYLFSGIAQGSPPGHGLLAGYPGFIDGNAGVTTQALGGLAARDWLAGVAPWWNPYSGVGLPLAAEQQNAAFFLPFVLLLRLFNGVVWLKIVVQVLAGLATRALLGELALTRTAAVAGAACFELNGSFAWFGHGPIMPIAFLPLLLFGIERARREPFQGAFWTGIAIGWSLLAGFPETAYLDGLLGFAWAALRVGQAPGQRGTLMGAIALGGIAGVLLAAPPVLAFVQSLPLSFLGSHVDFRSSIFPPANRAMLLLPYLYGPPMFGALRQIGPASLAQFIHWFKTAGYLDSALLGLALMALRRRGPEIGLRFLLLGFTSTMLGRALGVAGLTGLVNMIPLLRHTMADLYVLPSCQMAITVLAAFAIDDWQHGRLSPRRAVVGGVGVLALAGASLPGAWRMIDQLRAIPLYSVYPLLSVLFAVAVITALVAILALPANAGRCRALAGLLVGQAALLFFLPLLAGTPRPRGLDRAAMAFLAAEPGFARVQAIGSLKPNYGAWFGVATIDHNYLPVPQAWVDDVRATLLPGMNGVDNVLTATDPAALMALQARIPALEAHGVSDVMVPADLDPFAPSISLPLADQGNNAERLDAPATGTLPGRGVSAGTLVAARLTIGTYGGVARGVIDLRLCQLARCSDGQASLRGAADNAALRFQFGPSMALTAGADITWRIAMDRSARPSAGLWLWPVAGALTRRAPQLTLILASPPDAPPQIYADTSVAIYRLRHPAPYFTAPYCAVQPVSRTVVAATCSRPSRLLRRELFDPGWRAARDGRAQPVDPDGLYQSVALPQGSSHWRFAYAPPGITAAWFASGAGALLLGLCAWCGRSSGRRRMIGRSTQRLSA